MDTVAIVDTSICTDNLGDEVIMDAVNGVVWDLFPNAYVFRVPSHEALSDRSRGFVREASWCFIGGTNLLSSELGPWGLWRLDEKAAAAYGSTRTVCLATGWNNYMPKMAPSAQALLQTTLSPDVTHSARDSYTRDHLQAAGRKAITTSCVTTWGLTPERCAALPAARSHTVVFTLSAWHPDAEADRVFVEVLRRMYKTLYFFPQMQDDYSYFLKFGWDDIKIVTTTMEAYNNFLENEDVDFVGTRLHGGIRAMQKGRRALILAIDNRAAEISKDTGLPVLQRKDATGVEAWIEAAAPTVLNLPNDAIEQWKAQFRDPAATATPKPSSIPEPKSRSLMVHHLKQAAKAALGRG